MIGSSALASTCPISSQSLRSPYPYSEKALVQRFEVAPGTIRQALSHLRELGWMFTVPQKATFVSLPENWPESR
jgi:DNA-binding GntR family transcriptional regulator